MGKWCGLIEGQPYSKANSRRAVRGRFIKSEEAMNYQAAARQQLAFQRLPGKKLLGGYCSVEMWIAYKSWRPDLDESLILDILQGYVYENDRQVVEKHIHRLPNDKGRPHAIIHVEEVDFDD